jgi:hypothetical protein
MRRIVLFCVLAVSLWADAQSQPIEATASTNPSGGATITVRNKYTSPLVAFVFIYTLRDAQATVYSASTGYYDAAIDPRQNHPVAPGEDVRLPYYAGNRGMIPVINVAGGLFADGFTFGQRDMVQTIMDRRNYALVTINRSIAELKQAVKDGSTRDQLISTMQLAMNEDRSGIGAGNNDMANLILTLRNQVFVDVMNARNPDGTPMAIDKFLPMEIENLTHRKEALLPPKP